ncbi:MAG: hypothetical protein M0Z48_13870 [Nitrospiraceae bacterium]|nr:hypothetical protein [Nitrospiraceae bacterium]
MHELRKDPLLSRWAAILENSLKPEEYGTFPAPREGLGLPAAGAQGHITVERGTDGIRVVKGLRLLDEKGELGRKGEGIYDKMNPIGVHEVVMEEQAGRSDSGGGQPEAGNFRAVLDIYLRRITALVKDARLRYVFIFRNMEGCAGGRPAPHGPQGSTERLHSEILATPVIPDFIKRELDGAKQYYQYKERCIFCDIMNEESRVESRVIARTEHFIAFCPYAPRLSFEFWIVPRRHSCAFEETSGPELDDLARLLPELLGRMGRALNHPPCYYIHTAPNRIPRKNLWHTLGDDYHWHIEVLPAGGLIGGGSAVDLGSGFALLATSPEDAARYIREA